MLFSFQVSTINKTFDFISGMEDENLDKLTIAFAAVRSIVSAFKFGCNAIRAKYPDQIQHLVPVLKKEKLK